MRILIVGADSNVGKELITKIRTVHPDWEIVGTRKVGSEMGCDCANVFDLDLIKKEDILRFVQNVKPVDVVVYLAAAVHEDGGRTDLAEILNHEVPFMIAELLLEKNPGLKFVFASTIAVYGEHQDPEPIDEEAACQPETVYAKTKYAAEQALISLMGKNGFRPLVMRIGTVISKTDRGQLNRMIRHIKRFRFFVVPRCRQVKKTFVHIGDLVDSIMILIQKPPKQVVYNVVGPVTDMELIMKAVRLSVKRFVVIRVPCRLLAMVFPKLLQNVSISSLRFSGEFGICFKNFEEGFVSEYVA